MNRLFYILLLVFFVTSKTSLEKNCLTRGVPQKFGILTTTYIRGGSTTMFKNYLTRYAKSECHLYENIYIIWNNQETPQQLGILQGKSQWKKNVYFLQTIENSLDFKYIIPDWATQKVFFSMDDDFGISCQTLNQGFQQWKDKSYGQISPLASFYGRSYVFSPQTQSFTYIDQIKLNKSWNYYHFGLTGIAFISRHLLQLYYADIYQIKQMRKQVVAKNNCQDLLLNFIISHMYPQLIPQYLNLTFISYGFTGVSATKAHGKYRAECITKFSQILGYNPIRYVLAKETDLYKQGRTDLNQNCLVNLKQQHYQQNFISNRAYLLYIKNITGVDNEKVKNQNKRLHEAKTQIQTYTKKYKVQMIKVQQPIHQQSMRKSLQQKQLSLHFDKQVASQQSVEKPQQKDHILSNPVQAQQVTKVKSKLQDIKSQQTNLYSYLFGISSIVVVMVIIFRNSRKRDSYQELNSRPNVQI